MSGVAYLFPLLSKPQKLSIALLGVTYNLRTRWSVSSSCWLLDLATEDDVPLVGSIPLVTGADLLEQYRYLEVGGGIIVESTQGPPDTVPSFTSLGSTGQVYFLPYTGA